MNADDDMLLQRLAGFVRSEARGPEAERLERLARGELSTEKRAALELESTPDPAAARAFAAHAPLPAATRARIVQSALASLQAPAQGEAWFDSEPELEPEQDDLSSLRALRRRRLLQRSWVAAPLLAAAIALLWIRP